MSLPLNPSRLRAIDGTTRRHCARLMHILLAPALLVMMAAATLAAPEYALSGRASDLAAIEIARTGDDVLTALDLLIFDDINGINALASIPMDVWLDPSARAGDDVRYLIESVANNLAATYALSERAGEYQPDPGHLRVMTFGAAIATWIENEVIPRVRVADTDIQRYYLANADQYLERQRAQVRYIFRQADTGNEEETGRIRAELEQVAYALREGQMDFAEAARQHSEAPSASEGGLLPPFYDGTYFSEFENQAFGLTAPGDLSGVFTGPEGLYLLQLEKVWPVGNIPIETIHEDIAGQLKFDHVRHYYDYYLRKLSQRTRVRNHAAIWSYQNRLAPIAYVGQTPLTRDQFLLYFDNPTDEKFSVRWNVVFGGVARWIEGETIMQDLARDGLDHSPWIERAGEIALAIRRGLHVLSTEVPDGAYQDIAVSLATLQNQPFFDGVLRQCRLVEFEYQPRDTPEMIAADRRAAQRLASWIDTQLAGGVLPVDPNPVNLAQWVEALTEPGASDLKAPLKELNRQAAESGWANLTFKIRDFGWVNSYPGSAWHDLIGNGQPGAVSLPYQMGSQTRRYLLISERPIEPETMKENEFLLRRLAHEIAGYGIFLDEVKRIEDEGAVEFVF